MNNKLNYPNWLVPLDIAKELKEIGFDEPTLFHYYENDFDVSVETNSYYDEGESQGYLSFYLTALKEENFNSDKKCISISTWEQVFAWFRKKNLVGLVTHRYRSKNDNGFSFEILDEDTDVFLYNTYEQAQEALVYKLIEIYKSE